ncbi:MAG TPA: YHS domain-containing (seleno)protein [Elainellaceae cyanobacterium]
MTNNLALFSMTAVLSVGLLVGCSGTPTTTTSSAESAQTDSTAAQSQTYVEDGIAIKGADPVAYFEQGDYVVGSSEFQYEWDGAIWQFASAENRDRFADSPEAYAPEYGGYCAWAVSQGQVAPIDPTAWAIVDGKLYLNYSAGVQDRWKQDIPGNIAKADENWPSVLSN